MTDSGMPKAVVFVRRPSPYESFPGISMQENTLSMWVRGQGMGLLRTYCCTEPNYLPARDIIDAMVGYSIRSGVDAIVFWTKDMLDDDSLGVLAEVSYTYGIDIWFIADSEEPWSENDDDDGYDVEDDDGDCPQVDVFMVISKGVA